MDQQSYEHAGPPPPRPEVPDQLPLAWSVPPPAGTPSGGPPPWPAWSPFLGMFAVLTFTLIVVVALSVVVELAGGSADEDEAVLNIGGAIAQNLALVGAAVALARMHDPDRASAAEFGIRRVRFWPAVGWIVVTWLCLFAFTLVWTLIVGPVEQDDLPEALGAAESTVALVFVGILVTVLAPIGEEFFFRGYMFGAMRRWVGLLPGALLTGAIFGVIHATSTGWSGLVVLAVFGFLLCMLYVWTRSLIPCMVLHAVNNSIAFGVSQSWDVGVIALVIAGSTSAVLAVTLPLARR